MSTRFCPGAVEDALLMEWANDKHSIHPGCFESLLSPLIPSTLTNMSNMQFSTAGREW
jgi:hypothetical protein